MSIILWIVFGGLVGWVASLIMKSSPQQGIVMDVVVGVIGAFLGGWIMRTINGQGLTGQFDLYSFLVALLGAVVLLAIVKAFRRA